VLTISLAAVSLVDCGGSQPPMSASGTMPENLTGARSRIGADRVRAASSSYRVLYSFTGDPDGARPMASLIDVKGILYGTTFGGGKHRGCCVGPGTVFSTTATGIEHARTFRYAGGKNSFADLINVGGTLYGTTAFGARAGCEPSGCGTIFSAGTRGKLHVLHSFTGPPGDGAFSDAGLINVRNTLYGTTSAGGRHGFGTVFNITTGGTEQVLHSFGRRSDGKRPEAALVNVDGTLYGTTVSGGAYGFGTVFSITPGGTEKVLHSFGSGNDGADPSAALIDVNGTLYGTTKAGGANSGGGTVFSTTPGGKEKVLHTFGKGADGLNPYAGLVDVHGTLYGTTFYGGSYGAGTVFSITTSGMEKLLYSFCSQNACADGSNPSAGLIDVSGTLYGTTGYSGAHGDGTVFALTP
jgi:uncharacterized repeat protein (TIGR03803 family)